LTNRARDRELAPVSSGSSSRRSCGACRHEHAALHDGDEQVSRRDVRTLTGSAPTHGSMNPVTTLASLASVLGAPPTDVVVVLDAEGLADEHPTTRMRPTQKATYLDPIALTISFQRLVSHPGSHARSTPRFIWQNRVRAHPVPANARVEHNAAPTRR